MLPSFDISCLASCSVTQVSRPLVQTGGIVLYGSGVSDRSDDDENGNDYNNDGNDNDGIKRSSSSSRPEICSC